VSLGCDIHGGRHLCLYFCYDCDVPACSVCLLHEHGPNAGGGSGKSSGGGHRTAKLRDALAARRDALKTLLNVFGPRLDRLESKSRRLSGGATGASRCVKLDDQTSSRVVTSRPASTNESESIPLMRHTPRQVRPVISHYIGSRAASFKRPAMSVDMYLSMQHSATSSMTSPYRDKPGHCQTLRVGLLFRE